MASTSIQSLTPPITSSDGVEVQKGNGSPNHTAAQGTLYIQMDASTTTSRLWINTNGSTTWTYFTSAA